MRGSINQAVVMTERRQRFTPAVILRLCMMAPALLYYGFIVWHFNPYDTLGEVLGLMWFVAWRVMYPFALLALPHVVSVFRCPERTLRITLVSYFAPIGFALILALSTIGVNSPNIKIAISAVGGLCLIGGLVWAFWPSVTKTTS